MFNVFSSGNERYTEFGKGSFSALMVNKSLNERFDFHNSYEKLFSNTATIKKMAWSLNKHYMNTAIPVRNGTLTK